MDASAHMTTREAIEYLEYSNNWRRGAEVPQPDPRLFGIAIDKAIEVMKESLDPITFKPFSNEN